MHCITYHDCDTLYAHLVMVVPVDDALAVVVLWLAAV